MKDLYDREIEYLRLSLTNKCNLNCSYCKRTDENDGDILTFDEIDKIVQLFSALGIKKIRLTGGEPLVREDILEIISLCKNKYNIQDVAITTNGILLESMAKNLKKAGLDRVNISIDSLKPTNYKDITKANSLGIVLDGIDKALEVGLKPVKINVVLMKDKNDNEIDDFIGFAKDRDVEVRFIEYMPMGKEEHTKYFISSKDILKDRPTLKEVQSSGNSVAKNYQIDGFIGKIGFISPMSEPFCKKCNKLRVTADCKLRFCLGDNYEIDLREIINNKSAIEIIKNEINQKPQTGFCEGFQTNRGMGNIGG
jgi:cyclic pyranopterin phosphate synthase